MADKNIGIALVLTAKNQASQVMDDFFSRTEAKLEAFGKGVGKVSEGMTQLFAAKKGFDFLEKGADAFGDMEQAGNYLKASMMTKGGILDDGMYEKMFQYSKKLSGSYTGSTAAYLDMVRVMKQNRLDPKDILGGIGEQSAKLAIYFDNMLPAATAEFAAHMKNDMGVATKEMYGVMDLVARIHDSGVGKTGQEAVDEMNQFFSKVGLGLSNLHTQGLEASKQMGALGAIFMAKGISGQSVGTNFRRILDGIADAGKVKKANDVAAIFHKHLDFFDKKGKFLGIDNFVSQIGKLQGLNPTAIEKILNPFSGKQGLSTDFMQFLANEGLQAYPEMKRKIEQQAGLNEKVGVILKGQKMQAAVLQSNLTNTQASFGAAIQAPYKKILEIFNKVTVAMGNFLDQHPKLARVAGSFIAIASAAYGLMGIIKIFKGIVLIARVLNLTLAMNPILLIAAALIGAAVLIYTYWDEIKGFFTGMWTAIKSVFSGAWNWFKNSIFIYFTPIGLIFKYWKPLSSFFKGIWDLVKAVFLAGVAAVGWVLLNMTPAGLIYKHWRPIVGFFSNLWNDVKGPFMAIFKWIWNFGSKFVDAGKHIIDSIIDGIMNKIGRVGEVMQNVAKKIRAYLPFSPAKEGPLRDIHRVKIIETIAESIKPKAMLSAWENTIGALRGAMNHGTPIPIMANGSRMGGGASITFAPVINLTGSATQADANLITSAMENNFKKMMDNYLAKQRRISF